mgnify:CR=1 FL=1
MNGHKSRTKVLIVLSAVAVTAFMVTITLSPIAVSAILLAAITTLVFVPRFILSSTDHCKIALIVSKHRQKERTLKFQSSSFFFIYFLIGIDIKMEKSKDNRFVIIVKIEKYMEYIQYKY